MAYDYFTQPNGPAVSISLFSDAANAGIAAAKNLPSTFTSAVQGIEEGINFGQKVIANNQAATINQNTIDRIPQTNAAQDVQNERQRLALETERLNNVAKQATADSDLIIANKTAEANAKLATQKVTDLSNADEINTAIGSKDAAALNNILTNPKYQGTLLRDNNLALQVLGAASTLPGVDPQALQAAKASYDAIEIQKARQKQLEYENNLKSQFAVKNEEKFRDAAALLESLPGVDAKVKASIDNPEAYDYRKLQLYPVAGLPEFTPDGKLQTDLNGNVKTAPIDSTKDKSYVLAYGNEIVDQIPEIEAREYATRLRDYKTGKQVRGAFIPSTQSQGSTQPKLQELPTNAAQATGFNAPTVTATSDATADVNQNIIQKAKEYNAAKLSAAAKEGTANTYTTLQEKGRALVNKNTPPINPISTPQNVPVPQGTLPITTPTPTLNSAPVPTTKPVTKETAQVHLSNLMGGADISLNTEVDATPVTGKTIKTVNSIPALENKSALLKGLVTIESGGNPNAVSKAGAVGLTQLMTGAAKDTGISDDERFDAVKNVNAGEAYYNKLQTQIGRAYSKQGLNLLPDPRVVLAAYNGGAKYIFNAISAGNTSWEDIKDYIKSVKSEEAVEQNLAYPDKVILASIPYIQGGNASDDAYIKSLINFGIIEVA